MTEIASNIELVGYTDILLIDRATSEVVEHIRKRNQITEPFARWLLTGNLCTHNPSSQDTTSDSLTVDSNSVSLFLGSRSIPRYQTITTSCGTGEFGIYLLSTEVDIKPDTQIPPYLKADLNALSDKLVEGKNAVVYYGTPTTQNAGRTMAVDNGGCRWSALKSNPSFQTTYVKDDTDTVIIKSVVLGTAHNQLTSDGYSAHIAVRQSPSVLPQEWDNAWDNASLATSQTLRAPTVISKYLVAPFLRGTMRAGRYGDGLYTSGQFGTNSNSFINYYDLASKQAEYNSGDAAYNLAKTNGLTGETYATDPNKCISDQCSGGFAIGSGKAIRLDKGAETFSTSGVSRQVLIRYQERLAPTDASSNSAMTAMTYSGAALLFTSTEGTSIPETIYRYCAPVMVAKRGATPAEDLVEGFISLGVGTFTDATLGPTGTGVEIHKFAIRVGLWREMTANTGNLSAWIGSGSPNLIIRYGRVAVLPYAIGRTNTVNSEQAETSTTGTTYSFGTHDGSNDGTAGGNCYYLPITHILSGVSLHDWSFSTATADDLIPMLCANNNFQPGLILDDEDYTRNGDFIFAMAPNRNSSSSVASRIAMLVNDEGLNPVILNSDQHWNETHSLVMSGLTLETPITKTAEQILVVRYAYAFEIQPAPPARPLPFDVSLPSPVNATSLAITWTPTENTERYLLRRSTLSDFSEDVRLPVPSPLLGNPNSGYFLDTGLLPNRLYYYRFAAANVGGWLRPWCEDSQKTEPLIDPVVAPTDFRSATIYARSVELVWQWPQPTPLTDSSVRDDITLFFQRYRLQYQQAVEVNGVTPTLEEALASDTGWIDVDDTDSLLTDKATVSWPLIGLSPSSSYYVRIRAEIEPSYYENAHDAQSAWTGLALDTDDLPMPSAVAGIEIRRTDYDYANGTLEVVWNGQADMSFQVRYKRDDDDVEWNPANVRTVEGNRAIFANVPYAQWSQFKVRVWPFNESYPLPDDTLGDISDIIGPAEATSSAYPIARGTTESGGSLAVRPNTNTAIAYETVEINGVLTPVSTDISYGGFTESTLSRLFAQPVGTEPPAMMILSGSHTGTTNTTGYELYRQTHLKIRLGFDNSLAEGVTAAIFNDENDNTSGKCIAWKLPFELYKLDADGRTINFNPSVKLKMTLFGGREGSSDVVIGTLADVLGGALEERYVSLPFSTLQRGLVATNAEIRDQSFDYYTVEWDICASDDGEGQIVTETEQLILRLAMWGLVTDENGIRFEFQEDEEV